MPFYTKKVLFLSKRRTFCTAISVFLLLLRTIITHTDYLQYEKSTSCNALLAAV